MSYRLNPEIIKNPFNYTGSKNRIMSLILDCIPENIYELVDVFGGSGEVGLSVGLPCVYNDLNKPLTCIIKTFQELPINLILDSIQVLIDSYDLSKNNKKGYLELRKDFNEHQGYNLLNSEDSDIRWANCIALYILICHSFNYYITFNSKGEYNNPSGYNRSWFSESLKNKLIKYKERLDQMCKFEVNCVDYNEILDRYLIKDDLRNVLFFIDPPYLVSQDIYSRNKKLKWTKENEINLYQKLLTIHSKGGRIILTNQLQKGDYKNEILQDFITESGFDIVNTMVNFDNCSYQRKNKGYDKEILVKNFK